MSGLARFPALASLFLILSCDSLGPTVPGSDGLPYPTEIAKESLGPIPGPMSLAAPEPGPAKGSPGLDLSTNPPADRVLDPGPVRPSAGLPGPEGASAGSAVPHAGGPILVGEGMAGTDVVWRNNVTGENAIWVMDGTSHEGLHPLPTVPDQCWQIAGTGGFTGDAKPDIVWRNSCTGEIGLWELDGGTVVGLHWLPMVSDLCWKIVGTGDLDGDADPDILWRNLCTAEMATWAMDGLGIAGLHLLPVVGDLTWRVAGVADLTGDAKPDLIWRHTSTGQVAVWEMDGTTFMGLLWLPPVPDLAWDLAGIGEMTGDGKNDILWRNMAGGENGVWTMDGLTVTAVHWLPEVGETAWEIVGVGDLVETPPILAAWSEVQVSGSLPLSRAAHSAVYDPQGHRMIVFGGWSSVPYNSVRDTWALDLTSHTWAEIATSGSLPPNRAGHAAVYDSNRGRMVVFGGSNWWQTWYNDVWVLNLGTNQWSQLLPTGTAPSPRYWPGGVYRAETDELLLFGGRCGSVSNNWAGNDVWALSLETAEWRQISVSGDAPDPRWAASLILDEANQRLIVFGGANSVGNFSDTWALDLQTNQWSPLPGYPNGVAWHAAAHAAGPRLMVAVAGQGLYSHGQAAAFSLAADQWSTLAISGALPIERQNVSAIWDPIGLRVIMFGGDRFSLTEDYNDTWQLSIGFE